MKFRLIFFLASLLFVSAQAVTPAQSAVYYQVVFPTDGHIINVRFGVDSNRQYNLVMPLGTSAGDQAYILSLPQFNNFGYSGVAPIVTLGNVIDPAAIPAGPGSGTVTLVSWVGGIVSVANGTTTPQFTIAGTSGGIPYFSNGTTWASSAALANQQLMIGGGAGGAPSTTSTANGILTFIGSPSSANLFATLTDKTGTGLGTFATSPAFTTSVTTGSTSFSVFNTNATTVNAFGGASVALNMGHASGATSMLGIIGLDGATPSASAAVVVPASTTGVSSLRILPGAAPTSPVNGDAWTTSAGLFIQINGATVGPLSASGGSGTVSSGTVNRLSKYTGATTVGNSLMSDDGTTATYTGTGGLNAVSFTGSGTTPAAISLPAGVGNIPALPANSFGFAAPVTGGTSYLLKPPATITAGIPVFAAPATADGVNESAFTMTTAPAGTIVGTTDTQTLTNKRVRARITTITSNATPTVNTDTCDCVTITALAAAITSMTTNLTGNPVDFDQLEYRIKDDGTPRAITWGASFVAGPTALPTTTVTSKALHVFFEWDSVQTKWVCLSSGSDA